MRHLLLSLFFIGMITNCFSQCGTPAVEAWTSGDEQNFFINYSAPENVDSYWLRVAPLIYSPINPDQPETIVTGDADPGINTVEVDASNINPLATIFEDNYFFAELKTICANGDTSSVDEFYLSAQSLIDNPAFDCGQAYFQPIIEMPNAPSDVVEANVIIPPQNPPLSIEDISIFLDIMYNNIGLTRIEIISPNGTEVTLVEDSVYFGSENLSVLFSDAFQPQPDSTYSVSEPVSGYYAPVDPLSALENESVVGEWTLQITNVYGGGDGYLYGICVEGNDTPCSASANGSVYYDVNSNGMQDADEPIYYEGIVQNSINNSLIPVWGNGYYTTCPGEGSGELSLLNTPQYYTSPVLDLSLSEGDNLTGVDIPLSPIEGINDFSVQLFAEEPDRPGFDNTYVIQYQNIGTECIDPASIEAIFDESITLLDTDNEDATIGENSVNIVLGELCPQESGQIEVEINVDDTVSIGSILTSSATISPVDGDEDASNNEEEFNSEVVGSYDPNDKQVNVAEFGPQFLAENKPLKYLIRFQNTGNYYAENVVITDTLDPNLDLSTLDIIAHSHAMEYSREGNVVFFEFNDIFLPDSTSNEPESHGYVRFSVEPDASINNSTTIDNQANIYFDFNEPIITNTTTSVYDISLGNENPVITADVYPNPTSSILVIEWPDNTSIQSFEIIDLSGKTVGSVPVSKNRSRVDINVEDYAAGMYFVKPVGAGNAKPTSWIKN